MCYVIQKDPFFHYTDSLFHKRADIRCLTSPSLRLNVLQIYL
jgi:hypothetical protein